MMEEWWVSSTSQTGPEDLAGWRRPFKRFRAVPHDVWLMSQPVCQKKIPTFAAFSQTFDILVPLRVQLDWK